MYNSEQSFVNGFTKTAGAFQALLRKSVKPVALLAGGGGIAAGGYAFGKGKGKDEQVNKDEKWFRGYLKADRQRDLANIRRAVQVGARYGYQQGQLKKPKKKKAGK